MVSRHVRHPRRSRQAADRGVYRSLQRAIVSIIGLFVVLAAVNSPGAVLAQGEAPAVYVARIEGTIDLGLAPYLRRVLDQAEAADAVAVVLVIDTPGGRLDAALQMRDALLGSPVRTVAFVDREAFSAGALIALASREIYFAPGGVMGAATPVDVTGETADPKIVSAVRKTFKATAEARGRDPQLAEAMVDPAVEIPGLVQAGELLTLTSDEATARGYADGIATDLGGVLRALGSPDAHLQEVRPSPAERLVRFLTEPVIASLLFTVGFLLLLGELFTEGFGALGLSGITSLAAFFWGHYLAGLTGWEGVALVLLGVALLAVEAFVLPGFGIAGIAGAAALLGGLYLTVAGGEIVTPDAVSRGLTAVAVALVTAAAGSVLGLVLLPRLASARGIVLRAEVDRSEPASSARPQPASGTMPEPFVPVERREDPDRPRLAGRRGVALTDLRPGGFALIDGTRVDVVTEGDYVRAGEPVEVVRDEGYKRVVRAVTDGEGEQGSTVEEERRWTG